MAFEPLLIFICLQEIEGTVLFSILHVQFDSSHGSTKTFADHLVQPGIKWYF